MGQWVGIQNAEAYVIFIKLYAKMVNKQLVISQLTVIQIYEPYQ